MNLSLMLFKLFRLKAKKKFDAQHKILISIKKDKYESELHKRY